jgi:hypothetical protein
MFMTQVWQDLLFPGNAKDFFERRSFPPFDPNANEYSPINALWLAELSRLVYRHDTEEDNSPSVPTRTSFLSKVGLLQRQFFLSKETDTQSMLVESCGATPFAVLVFRGTEQTPKDGFADANIGRFPLEKERVDVHDGFETALASVWDRIAAELALLPAGCPVFFTGHSLGAALATLAAARHAPKAVYTFGSPRVGNQAFVYSLKGITIYRVVDDEDSVATVPPEAIGFSHVGEVHQLVAQPSPFQFQLALDLPKPLADHAPVNYVDRIAI